MIEYLVGVNVTSEEGYQAYRDRITPLIHGVGGEFRYDFKVSETLKSAVEMPMNRVFVLRFPSREVKEAFFAREDYLAAKKAFFAPSVSAGAWLASYEVEA